MDPEVWRVQEGKLMCFCWCSIITHYQISLTNAAVGTRLKFHSSDRFLMRYPLDVFTSGHLRVFLLFCAFSECQWGPNIYIYIGLHCLLLCRLKNQWEHLHFWGNYIFTSLPCLKSSLGGTFDRVSFVMMSFSCGIYSSGDWLTKNYPELRVSDIQHTPNHSNPV